MIIYPKYNNILYKKECDYRCATCTKDTMIETEICSTCLNASDNHRLNTPPCNCQEEYYDSGDIHAAPEVRIQCIRKMNFYFYINLYQIANLFISLVCRDSSIHDMCINCDKDECTHC